MRSFQNAVSLSMTITAQFQCEKIEALEIIGSGSRMTRITSKSISTSTREDPGGL